MKIETVIELTEATLVCGGDKREMTVERGFSSDLMSDVLTLDTEGLLLITGLANIQTIRTAEMADIRYILFVRNKKVAPEMEELARENNMVLLATPFRYSRPVVFYTIMASGRSIKNMVVEQTYKIRGDFTHAGDASSKVKKLLKQLDVDPRKVKSIVIALYEAEVNIVAHAWEGVISIMIDSDHIRMVLEDKGPGIADIEQAMVEGYSTASREVREMGFGAGMGLSNMKRNTDLLEITSKVGVGTTVTMVNYF